MGNTANEKLNAATAKITGKRFCSHHGGEVLADSGSFVTSNKSRRWICHRCQMKSIKRNEEIEMEKLHRNIV